MRHGEVTVHISAGWVRRAHQLAAQQAAAFFERASRRGRGAPPEIRTSAPRALAGILGQWACQDLAHLPRSTPDYFAEGMGITLPKGPTVEIRVAQIHSRKVWLRMAKQGTQAFRRSYAVLFVLTRLAADGAELRLVGGLERATYEYDEWRARHDLSKHPGSVWLPAKVLERPHQVVTKFRAAGARCELNRCPDCGCTFPRPFGSKPDEAKPKCLRCR